MRLGVGIAAIAVVLAGTASSAAAGRGAFIPPMEVELGHAVTGARGGRQVEATQLLVGLSWASLYPKPTPVDVSVGVISMFRSSDETTATARVVGAEEDESAVGGYIDVAVRGAAGKYWRTWIGARGELIDHGRVSRVGGAARASIEVWAGTAAGGHDALILGTVALSAWAETGLREQPFGGSASFVAAGLGMRLPLIVAGR